jgi:hypothetical protein
VEVLAGHVIRIIAIDGPQVADTTFVNLDDPREGFHAGQSVALNMLAGTGTMRRLTHLYSRPPRENVMLTVIDDPVAVHFAWNGGRCSRRVYEVRDGITTGHRTCQDILAEAVAPWGLIGDDVPDVYNVFMNTDVADDRRLDFKPTKAVKGDYIDLRAEMNILAAGLGVPERHVAVQRVRAQASLMASRWPTWNWSSATWCTRSTVSRSRSARARVPFGSCAARTVRWVQPNDDQRVALRRRGRVGHSWSSARIQTGVAGSCATPPPVSAELTVWAPTPRACAPRRLATQHPSRGDRGSPR